MIDPLVNGEMPLDYTQANIIQARVTRKAMMNIRLATD